jgi:fumarylacetoacetate (FAA) hydrolase
VKLGTLKEGGRDGTLVVVSRDLKRAIKVPDIAPTLQYALENWDRVALDLERAAKRMGGVQFAAIGGASPFNLDIARLAAPLPRAYQFLDGSAYLHHAELVRRARGAELPPSFLSDPLMYQGVSDGFLGPQDDIPAVDEEHGIDFEAEVVVVLGDVPMGVTAAEAGRYIRLIMLVNDVSLRNVIPKELPKGFGFVVGKPTSSFSPVAVTPDELGSYWDGGKINLPLVSHLNGKLFGNPNAGVDMNFDFPALIAHAAQTRRLSAGTILGAGTVSNKDPKVGSSCIAERRTLEQIHNGKATTPYMKFGDRVHIEMLDGEGKSIFGAIDQRVVRYAPRGAKGDEA